MECINEDCIEETENVGGLCKACMGLAQKRAGLTRQAAKKHRQGVQKARQRVFNAKIDKDTEGLADGSDKAVAA